MSKIVSSVVVLSGGVGVWRGGVRMESNDIYSLEQILISKSI
jgi:hypothetical protein